MERNEAVIYLKEILFHCEYQTPRAFFIMEEKHNDSSSEGYSIHIRTLYSCINQIGAIAKKYGLSLKEENGETIVFTP